MINSVWYWAVALTCCGMATGCTLDRQPHASQDPVGDITPGGGDGPVTAVQPSQDGTSPGGGDPAGQPEPATSVFAPCDCEAGCTELQCQRANGDTCDKGAQCASGNCNNGLCCENGACCNTVADCAAGNDGVAAVCQQSEACQGSRGQVTCEQFRCVTTAGIDDDTGCDRRTEASTCGPYPSVLCNGAAEQTAPTCATSCGDDTDCDPDAHCKDGTCRQDVPDGGACEQGRECASNYCGRGVCCAGGDCCQNAEDCPSRYDGPATCDEPDRCQGTRRRRACIDAVCETGPAMDDDSGCKNDTLANDCGQGADQFCSGEAEQDPPACPSWICADDGDCDEQLFCNLFCTTDKNNGEACSRDAECASGHCGNNICCPEGGDCCTQARDCSVSDYGRAPQCNNTTTCQGDRVDPVCNSRFLCARGQVLEDDSACDGPPGRDCGTFRDRVCTGQVTQTPTCPNTCGSDGDCDQGFVCLNQACVVPPAPDAGM